MVTIGATGHRILTETDKINDGVDAALKHIGQWFPKLPHTVLSPLAEGADRLVAQRMLAHSGSRLVVPLPVPREEYMTDFESAESQREFAEMFAKAERVIELPPVPSRGAAYDAAGKYVLDHCDVLIAVWDGQHDNDTGRMVMEARRRGLPIAWIHAGNRKPGTNEPTSLGEEQGTVTFENFDARHS